VAVTGRTAGRAVGVVGEWQFVHEVERLPAQQQPLGRTDRVTVGELGDVAQLCNPEFGPGVPRRYPPDR